MRSVYRKSGRTKRVEIEQGTIHRLDLEEVGEAVEEGRSFECRTLSESHELAETPPPPLPEIIDAITGIGPACERATITSGSALHAFREGNHEARWTEQSARLHVTIINHFPRVRVVIERGGRGFDPGWADEIHEIATAVTTVRGHADDPGEAVQLEPAVTASLLSALSLSPRHATSAIPLAQVPREDEVDGKGRTLSSCAIETIDGEPIGWYRPSYRARPQRVPHGIDFLGAELAASESTIRAIALTSFPRFEGTSCLIPCLLQDGDVASIRTVAIDLSHWNEQVRIVGDRGGWFPFMAGAWGRPIVVRSDRG